jgi:deoxyribonuclease IV
MAPMLPDDRRLGAHLPLGAGMVKAVDRAHAIDADAIQIFTDNPTAWRRRAAPPTELPAFRARLRQHGVGPVAVHASYLVNLAGPEPELWDRSVELLTAELVVAPSFGGRFVNVHIGSHRGEGVDFGIGRLVEGVCRSLAAADAAAAEGTAARDGLATPDGAAADGLVPADGLDDPPAMLVLENSVGSGWGLGVDLDELSRIADSLRAADVPAGRVGFCLDTAHAWGAGVDLASPDAIDAFLETFDARIGRDRLVMVHFNDTRAELGSRADRHEHLGAGQIGAVGLGHVLTHPLLARATYYLETPGMSDGFDAINIARARALAAGEPLEDLPPEAFELAASASGRTAPA